MMTSNWKGILAEHKAATRAIELGYTVCWPSSDCRYDLILDDGNTLFRVQVKSTNRIVSHCQGAVSVNLTYETRQRRRVLTYSQLEVDVLIVYLPAINKLCWFDQEYFIGKTAMSIRLTAPRNGQTKGIIYANDHFW